MKPAPRAVVINASVFKGCVTACLLALAAAPATSAQAPAAQGRFVDVNKVRIYYEVEGHGEPLVLIHGWSLNLRMWDLQARDFARHYQVIRLDRRGFGQSSGSEDNTWDVDDLRGVLDALGITRAHLLGMSQGARVALTFAVTHPERVRGLILHSAPGPEGFGLPFTGPDRLTQSEFEALAKSAGLDAARRAWAAHPLMEIPPGHPDARGRTAALLAAYPGGRWLSPVAASGPARFASMADLAHLSTPVLIVIGARDVPYFRIVAEAVTYAIPGAKKAVIPGGGHMVNIIEPALYNRAVLGFLRAVRDPR